MLELLPALGSLLFVGASGAATKLAIAKAGRHKALMYSYVVMVALLWAGAFAAGITVSMPEGMWAAYAIQVVVGAGAVIAFFKAMEHGSSSVMIALSESYVLIVIGAGVLLLGESLPATDILGSLLIIGASALLAFEGRNWKLEKGAAYMALTVLGWGYYYAFLKVFVSSMGFYEATLALESGIFALIAAYYMLRGRDVTLPPPQCRQVIIMRGGIVFSSALLYALSVSIIGVALTAAIGAGSPVANAVVSRIILKERLDGYKCAAILLMAAGLALIAL
ncbi:MAG: DMT family transporter [Candidatus Micrarchaeota archaeon]